MGRERITFTRKMIFLNCIITYFPAFRRSRTERQDIREKLSRGRLQRNGRIVADEYYEKKLELKTSIGTLKKENHIIEAK